jgi:DNA-binding NtrC family response regulator
MISGEGTVELAVRAVREGASDFVEKPIRPERLVVSLENALKSGRMAARYEALEAQLATDEELVGSSEVMQKLRALVARAGPSDGRVLITGESGTGKELVARAIHRASPRQAEPIVKINCAAVPAELIESELFGHIKGAFTGAATSRKGKFELAHNGTLLLDEVGDMPPAMQAKMLRVLQEGEIEPVGAGHSRWVDVRVIAATNQDLEAMVEAGKYREDLYYRLNVVPIHVPPLRERKEDIPELVERFVGEVTGHVHGMEPEALELFAEHDFPGNVRELRNLVERMVILAEDELIKAEEVAGALGRTRSRGDGNARLYREGVPLKDLLAEAEKTIIEQALVRHDWNMAETARSLGLERSHLYKKAKAHGLERGKNES